MIVDLSQTSTRWLYFLYMFGYVCFEKETALVFDKCRCVGSVIND